MVDVVGQLKDTLTNLLVSGVDIVEQGEIVKRENENSDIEGYDAVVLPLTLEALYEDERNEHAGWEVRERHGFNLDIDFPAVRVAILGNFNAGKTLVAHRLSNNPDLISGHRRSTHGISFVCTNLNDPGSVCFKDDSSVSRKSVGRPFVDNSLCALIADAAGNNTPVSTAETAKLLQLYQQDHNVLGQIDVNDPVAMRVLTKWLRQHVLLEEFIQTVLYHFAQVYILVVGQLSHSDQNDLVALSRLIQQNPGVMRDIIVLHNLKDWSFDDLIRGRYVQTVAKLTGATLSINLVDQQLVPELQGGFGVQAQAGGGVIHLFLTDERRFDCRNTLTFARIRQFLVNRGATRGPLLQVLREGIVLFQGRHVYLNNPNVGITLPQAGSILLGYLAVGQGVVEKQNAPPDSFRRLYAPAPGATLRVKELGSFLSASSDDVPYSLVKVRATIGDRESDCVALLVEIPGLSVEEAEALQSTLQFKQLPQDGGQLYLSVEFATTLSPFPQGILNQFVDEFGAQELQFQPQNSRNVYVRIHTGLNNVVTDNICCVYEDGMLAVLLPLIGEEIGQLDD